MLAAYLSYRDAPAAITWLETLGFAIVVRQDGEDGTVAHAELKRDDAVVMLSSFDDEYEIAPLREHSTGHGLYLVVDDPGALHDAAVDAGGRSVFGEQSTEWGTKRARVLDPEGYEWSFGTYAPGAGWG